MRSKMGLHRQVRGRVRSFLAVAAAAVLLGGCMPNTIRPPESKEGAVFAPWVEGDDAYRLGPGDDVEVKLPFNAEFNERTVIGPDGRITLPLVGELRAEGRTVRELTDALNRGFSRDLVNPRVQVAVRAYGSQRVFVGGEVGNPGLFTLPGRIGVMEAVMMANGFTDGARTSQVVLIRRSPDGRAMMRTVDVPAFVAGEAPDMPLKGFDIVFVPKSTIAEVDQFVEQFINRVVPFQRGFTYTMGRTQTQ